MSVPPLGDVRTSLVQWDAGAVRDRLATVNLSGKPFEVQRRLHPTLLTHLGAWYAAGPTLGDETVDGWCWCHSFAKAGDRYAQIDSMTAQLGALRQWRVELLQWLDARPRSRLELGALEPALVDLLTCLDALGVNEMWYAHVGAGIAWLLDHHQNARTKALVGQLKLVTSTHFTSWVGPTAESSEQFANDAAWRIVEADLDAY